MAKVELKYIFEDEYELAEFNTKRLEESNNSLALFDFEQWLRGIRKHGDVSAMVDLEAMSPEHERLPEDIPISREELMLEIIVKEFFKFKAENHEN